MGLLYFFDCGQRKVIYSLIRLGRGTDVLVLGMVLVSQYQSGRQRTATIKSAKERIKRQKEEKKKKKGLSF